MKWDGKLFVYGTLQPGCALHSKIRPAMLEEPVEVHTAGRLYHVSMGSDRSPVYPVAKFDEEGTIFGTMLTVDPDAPETLSTVLMELRSGYEARPVRVWRLAGDELFSESEPEIAAGFQYLGHPGPRITSGSWIKAAGRMA